MSRDSAGLGSLLCMREFQFQAVHTGVECERGTMPRQGTPRATGSISTLRTAGSSPSGIDLQGNFRESHNELERSCDIMGPAKQTVLSRSEKHPDFSMEARL